MQGPVFDALVEIAALTGRAASNVAAIPPLKAGPQLDQVCAELSQQMESQRLEMTAELIRTAERLEEMIFAGEIGFTDEIGEG